MLYNSFALFHGTRKRGEGIFSKHDGINEDYN